MRLGNNAAIRRTLRTLEAKRQGLLSKGVKLQRRGSIVLLENGPEPYREYWYHTKTASTLHVDTTEANDAVTRTAVKFDTAGAVLSATHVETTRSALRPHEVLLERKSGARTTFQRRTLGKEDDHLETHQVMKREDDDASDHPNEAPEAYDLACGKEQTSRRLSLSAFSVSVGGTDYHRFRERGIAKTGSSADLHEFPAMFHEAIEHALANGRTLHFDLTDVEVGKAPVDQRPVFTKERGITAWELREIVNLARYRLATKFYVGTRGGYRELTSEELTARGL